MERTTTDEEEQRASHGNAEESRVGGDVTNDGQAVDRDGLSAPMSAVPSRGSRRHGLRVPSSSALQTGSSMSPQGQNHTQQQQHQRQSHDGTRKLANTTHSFVSTASSLRRSNSHDDMLQKEALAQQQRTMASQQIGATAVSGPQARAASSARLYNKISASVGNEHSNANMIDSSQSNTSASTAVDTRNSDQHRNNTVTEEAPAQDENLIDLDDTQQQQMQNRNSTTPSSRRRRSRERNSFASLTSKGTRTAPTVIGEDDLRKSQHSRRRHSGDRTIGSMVGAFRANGKASEERYEQISKSVVEDDGDAMLVKSEIIASNTTGSDARTPTKEDSTNIKKGKADDDASSILNDSSVIDLDDTNKYKTNDDYLKSDHDAKKLNERVAEQIATTEEMESHGQHGATNVSAINSNDTKANDHSRNGRNNINGNLNSSSNDDANNNNYADGQRDTGGSFIAPRLYSRSEREAEEQAHNAAVPGDDTVSGTAPSQADNSGNATTISNNPLLAELVPTHAQLRDAIRDEVRREYEGQGAHGQTGLRSVRPTNGFIVHADPVDVEPKRRTDDGSSWDAGDGSAQHGDDGTSRKRMIMCCVAVAVVLVGAVVAAAILLLSPSDDSAPAPLQSQTSRPTQRTASPTNLPTASPSMPPTETREFDEILDILEDILAGPPTFVNASMISDPSSIPHQTLDWMTNVDMESRSIIASNSSSQTTQRLLDRYSLVSIYLAVGGDEWFDKYSSMMSTTDVCDWVFGELYEGEGTLSCDQDGIVEELYLHNKNSRGRLPDSLYHLNLARLNIYGLNGIRGTISPHIAKMSRLVSWDTSDSRLTGSIPSEIGQLTTMTNLILDASLLSGSLPSELGNMVNLNALILNDNAFTGQLPAELGSCNNLIALHLNVNKFNGTIPSELGNLVQASSIYLDNNELEGMLPAEFANLTNLSLLTLDNNFITGDLDPILCAGDSVFLDLGSAYSDCGEQPDGTIRTICSCCRQCVPFR
mmetsp:Transcript_3439/g.9770  ORF Transcript_3439/g.9770 Transcript_3439/m.9770 type:complete len:992 (-) Transcript_3439:203-3178(-)